MKAIHAVLAVALLAAATSAGAVDLHGYFRQGVGGSSKGGDQVAFGNTGQGYKLRLGNEDNWSEFEFVQSILKDSNGVEWTAGFMLGWGNGFSSNQDLVNGGPGFRTPDGKTEIDTGFGSLGLKQEYIRATFPQLGGAAVWGGTRYYHRSANDMFDYFYMDKTGPGVGIEALDVGVGKLALAVMRFQSRQPSATITPANYEPAFWMGDVRLEGIPVNPGGTLDLAALGRFRSWNKELAGGSAPDQTQSFSPFLMVKHSQTGILNGGNNLAVTYQTGCFLDDGCSRNRWRLTVSEDLTLQPTRQVALAFAGIWITEQDAGKVKTNGYGIGFRPLIKLADHLGVRGDAGYFWNKSDAKGSKANTMFKTTIAPVIVPFRDGFAESVRPEIRFFVTYATWNKEQNDTAGFAGGTFGPDATSGVTFGTQVETWF